MCRSSYYFGHFLVFLCTFSGYVSISAFCFISCVSVDVVSFAVRSKICELTAGIHFNYQGKRNALTRKRGKSMIK